MTVINSQVFGPLKARTPQTVLVQKDDIKCTPLPLPQGKSALYSQFRQRNWKYICKVELVARQYENWTFKKVLIKYLLEQESWISGGVLGMTSFGPKKKNLVLFFLEPRKALSAQTSALNLIFFFASVYFINPFSHLPTLNSSVGSILLRKWKPPWRYRAEQKCTPRPRPGAAKKSPSVILSGESTQWIPACQECSGLIKTCAVKECSWEQAGSLRRD